MAPRIGMRTFTLLTSGVLAGLMTLSVPAHADVEMTPVAKQEQKQMLLKGSTTASYYWDDGSGRNGDTGLPASGHPMQKGLAASPSWPLMTEGYVIYKGKKAPFFVGDRGPGTPSNRGIMLDLDAKTFAYLMGGSFNTSSLTVSGVGGQGHAKVEYVITKWGNGSGKKNHPVAFSTGAYGRKDGNPAKPLPLSAAQTAAKAAAEAGKKADAAKAAAPKPAEKSDEDTTVAAASAEAPPVSNMAAKENIDGSSDTNAAGLVLVGGLAVLGGGLFLGRDRIKKLAKR
ncbi:hypothetical protein ACIBH1_14785 [Nonomuraea sp. NPDC050663]|uniref:hypothetical protein n=1 Tax=Nonomuraea sp. NPDC050663 TaxID=3364370 RepID=UPI0037ABCB2D